MLDVKPRHQPAGHTCPLCRDSLADSQDDRHVCPSCETLYHLSCAAELGGCSTLGCPQQGKRPRQLQSWFCRACHDPIEGDLRRRGCRCGAYLHSACVGAHAESCKQAAELGAQTSFPSRSTALAWAPTPGQRRRIDWGRGWQVAKAVAVATLVLGVIGVAIYYRSPWRNTAPTWLEDLYQVVMGTSYVTLVADALIHAPSRHERNAPIENRALVGVILIMLCPGLGALIYYAIWGHKRIGE